MTIDHTYRGVHVLTLSDVEAVIDRLLAAEQQIATLHAERDKLYASGLWLVARKRDTEPWEVYAFDRYDKAAMFFESVAWNWSTVYFCRVAYCEGFPLDVQPVINAFAAQRDAAVAAKDTAEARCRELLDMLKAVEAEARSSITVAETEQPPTAFSAWCLARFKRIAALASPGDPT